MSTSSASIMPLVMRSRPFCRPKLHTMKPASTTTSVQMAISPGEDRRLPKTALTASVAMPLEKVPVRNLKK